jgi:D-3-phosphoglycerate dehydrogenase
MSETRALIRIANVPGYGTEEVSDHAAALLLACIRSLLTRDANLRRGRFETDLRESIFRTTGKTLGLIGYGQIGRALHRKGETEGDSGLDPDRRGAGGPCGIRLIIPGACIHSSGGLMWSLGRSIE